MRWADLLILNVDKEVLDFLVKNRFRVIGLVNSDLVPSDYRDKFLIIKRKIYDDIDRVYPSKDYLVGFVPRDKDSARRAGKINGVISIVFDEENIEFCTREQITVMIRKNVFIEVLARSILDDRYYPKFMKYATSCIRGAILEGIDVILSSGARGVEELFSPGAFRVIERYITNLRGSLTYSWYRVLEKWRSDLVRNIDSAKRTQETT
ncbi:MAG: hypothetical protein ACP5GI_04730 [Sulfolobales archaeon]